MAPALCLSVYVECHVSVVEVGYCIYSLCIKNCQLAWGERCMLFNVAAALTVVCGFFFPFRMHFITYIVITSSGRRSSSAIRTGTNDIRTHAM